MNNEDIYEARKKYNQYLREAQELLHLKQELQELKNNPVVKRYLELESYDAKKVLTEEAMVSYSFESSKFNSMNLSDENKIFIYMGPYDIDNSYDSNSDIKLDDKEYEYADYLLYTNIDSIIDCKKVKPKYREQFENKYAVLKFSDTTNILKKYYHLQQFYFKQLLNIDLRKKDTILTLLRERLTKKS